MGTIMKYKAMICVILSLFSGCGTVGGAMQGFGSDIDQVGGYINDF